MAAWSIDKPSKSSVERRSIARLSLGRQYEAFAAEIARSLGYRILRRNFRLNRLEGDLLLADDARGRLLLWEVRGRSSGGFRPSVMMTPAKKAYLTKLARWVVQRTHNPVRLQLFEVVGVPPQVRWKVFDIDCGI